MAEQEGKFKLCFNFFINFFVLISACTELVDKATDDKVGSSFEGESQLLPLLQGLLEAPDSDQPADSGTESGEDQRSGLIAEVQNALDKLSTNLRDDAMDITIERRSSLLHLVSKLQAGLAASVPTNRRASMQGGRFRRRTKPARHTVGVSSEELADARRLIEEIHDLTPSQSKISVLPKQNSEGSVVKTAQFKPLSTQRSVVKNAVAKPFSSSNSTVSGTSSSVQTPTESENLDLLFRSVEDIKDSKPPLDPTEIEETDEDSTVKVQRQLPQPDIIMQTNPIYQSNKYNVKKIKMKRANTIDIPKPKNFYEDEDSDCSLPDDDYYQRRRSNYLALRGPIRLGGTSGKTSMPVFEPKTDNDKKFLAFINKHNESSVKPQPPAKASMWAQPEPQGNVWGSKFGNIRTAFEKFEKSQKPQIQNNARNFWMSTEKSKPVPNIITGSLQVKPVEAKESKPYKFVPQPLPVNKFSHAPQSAFKPLPRKAPPPTLNFNRTEFNNIKKEDNPESPLYLYSPKPPPDFVKPWAGTPTGEGRVLSLAASKFESVPTQQIEIKPRRLSTDRVNTVRQLSGQYDNLDSYTTYSSVKYTAPIKNQSEFLKVQQTPETKIPQNMSKQENEKIEFIKKQESFPEAQFAASPSKSQTKVLRNHNLSEPQSEVQYTSTLQYKPQTTITPKSPERHLKTQTSVENLTEYNAVNSRVMTGPVSQQATTVRQKSPMNRDEHEIQAALNLRNSIQKATARNKNSSSPSKIKNTPESPSNSPNTSGFVSPVGIIQTEKPKECISPIQADASKRYSYTPPELPKPQERNFNYGRQTQVLSPINERRVSKNDSRNLFQNQNFMPKSTIENRNVVYSTAESSRLSQNQYPASNIEKKFTYPRAQSPRSHSFSSAPTNQLRNNVTYQYHNDHHGDSVITSKFQIPVIHIPQPESPRTPNHLQISNKANSWNQICLQSQTPQHKPSPRSSPNARSLAKSKSSHTLAVPKQFEAGIPKDELAQKKKTMEAFLIGAQKPICKSPQNVKRSINRTKTSEKVSTYSQGLSRSRTLPDIVCPDFLDETNVDKAFDDLFKASS